jgi:tetratricopeptide (TPR) repeat protein
MNRLGIDRRQLSGLACGAVSFGLAFALCLTTLAQAGDDVQFEITLEQPAAAAPAEGAKKPALPSLDEQFASFEERLQTEPAPNIIRGAIQALRDQPANATKQHFALVDDWLTDALKAEPTSVTLRLMLAELRDAQDRQDDLIKLYRELLKDPKVEGAPRAIVGNNLAYALAVRGEKKDLPEAEAAIEEAIQALSPTADLLDTRATVRLAKGDLKGAREDVNAAIKDRASAVFYFHLAVLEEKAGDRDATRAAMQQAIQLKVERNEIPPSERKAFDRLKADLAEKK